MKRQTGGSAAPSGPAGGDLSGTYPNPTVARVNGTTVNPSPPTSGNLLIANGSDYQSQPMSGDATIDAFGGVALSATGVVPGSYTNTDLTVGADGRIIAASNGSAGSGTGLDPFLLMGG